MQIMEVTELQNRFNNNKKIIGETTVVIFYYMLVTTKRSHLKVCQKAVFVTGMGILQICIYVHLSHSS